MAKEKDIRQIYQLLADENLEAFYPAVRGQLKVEKVEQLLRISRGDLSSIGIVSGPDIKHFQRVLGKITKHGGVRGTLKNKIFKGKIRDQKRDQSLLMKMELLIRQEAVIIQSHCVHIEKEIGKGQFGTVYQGQWIRNYGDESVMITIAIKSIASEQGKFGMGEAQVLSEFGQNHPNIIKFYGLMIGDSQAIKLVTEFAEFGSLMDQLISGKIRQIATLCQFAVQIASGMAYLEKSNLVHRDLAARNILVTAHNQVKISDFGLSKSLGDQQEFVMENQEMLPLRWLAPECLNEGVFTTASDVWSFGIVLWEMFTLGQYPWELETADQVKEHITKGDMLPEPEFCPQRVYPYVMCRCWAQSAGDRPRFDELHERLIIHQPVVVSATENSSVLLSAFLMYSVDDSITCLKQIGEDVDLWLGQSQETDAFGHFRKSNMRPLAPTLLTPIHLCAIDSKMNRNQMSNTGNKNTAYFYQSDDQPAGSPPKGFANAFPQGTSLQNHPSSRAYPPVDDSTSSSYGSPPSIANYVNMNGSNFPMSSSVAEAAEPHSSLYANVGMRVVDGVCERFVVDTDHVTPCSDSDDFIERPTVPATSAASNTDAPPPAPAATSTDAAPTSTDAAPTSTDAALTSTDAAPTSTDAALTSTDAAPTSTDAALTSTDAAPTSTDAALTSTDAAPTSTDAAVATSTTAAVATSTTAAVATSTTAAAVEVTTKKPRPLVPPRPRPRIPPKPLRRRKEVASHVETSNGTVIGDNEREDAVCEAQDTAKLSPREKPQPQVRPQPRTASAGNSTFHLDVVATNNDHVFAANEDEDAVKDQVSELRSRISNVVVSKNQDEDTMLRKSVSATQLYEDDNNYAKVWESRSSLKDESTNTGSKPYRHTMAGDFLTQDDFSKSLPAYKKNIGRSQSTSAMPQTSGVGGAVAAKKSPVDETRSPETSKKKRRHFTLNISSSRSKPTVEPPKQTLDSNVLLDYIRRMKSEIPDANDWECIAALETNKDIVEFAIKHIKVNRIMDSGLFKREDDACQLLADCRWELEPGMREAKVRFLRHNFPSISVLECTETLDNFNWNVHEVSESFICRRYLAECNSIGVSQDVALLTLEKHNRDEVEAVHYLKASSVQEVTGRPYLRCREVLSNYKWNVVKSIDYLLDFNRASQP